MDMRWWSVFSNLFYLLPIAVALYRREWLRAVVLLCVGVASSYHHACESFGCDASARCTDVRCHSDADTPRRVRETDHTFAVVAFYSIALLFVPMGNNRMARTVEVLLHIPPAVATGISARHVIDTPNEDYAYIAIIVGWFVFSASLVRCAEGRSTVKRLNSFTMYCLSCGMTASQRLAWLAFAASIGATLFVWFYDDWASREPHHGLWHAGSALAAAVIIWLISRNRGDAPYSQLREDAIM